MTIEPRHALPTARGRHIRAATGITSRVALTREASLTSIESMSPNTVPRCVNCRCAVVVLSMLDHFCYTRWTGGRAARDVDDDAYVPSPADIFSRTIYRRGAGGT